jgi:hypothetical protein
MVRVVAFGYTPGSMRLIGLAVVLALDVIETGMMYRSV